MKKQNWKKVISLIAGSLVIALVVSILPGGFLVNAAEVKTAARAERIALRTIEEELNKNIDKEIVKVTVSEDNLDDKDNPYYTVLVETEADKYGAKVYSKTGEVIVKSEEAIRAEREITHEDAIAFDNFNDFKNYSPEGSDDIEDFIDNKGYEDYGDKPTVQAALNELLRDGKKAAISDFKEDGDKVAFEEAKGIIKDLKNTAKDDIKLERNPELEIKEDKKDTTEPDNKDKDDKSIKLVKNVKVEPEEALLIALKSIGFEGTLNDLNIELNDDDDDNEYVITNKQIKDLKIDNLDIEIVLNSENNPTTYIIELNYELDDVKITNTIKIHATSGKILDYKKEINDKVKVKDTDEKSIKVENQNIDKENNGNVKKNK